MKKNVLILTSFFPPQTEIAAIRIGSIIKYLNRLNWHVYVFTIGKSNGDLSDLKSNLKYKGLIISENLIDKILSKYRKKEKAFIDVSNTNINIDNIDILTKFKTYLKILYKILSLTIWMFISYWKLRGVIKKNKINKVFCTVPGIEMLVLGSYIKIFNKDVELVLEIRDVLFSNEIYKSKLTIGEQKFYYFLEKKCIQYVDKFVFLTEKIKEIYINEFDIEKRNKKFIVITNGFDRELYPNYHYSKGKELVISHFGSFYGTRHPIELVKAVGELINEKGKNIKLNLIGKFYEKEIEREVRELIKKYKIERFVNLVPNMEHCEVIKMEQSSDINIIITHMHGQSNYALPGKLFEYIGAMRPILAISNDELLCEIMNRYNLGYLVRENTKEKIKIVLEKIYEDWINDNLLFKKDLDIFNVFDRYELTKKLHEFLLL